MIPLILPFLGAAYLSTPLLEQRLTADAAVALRAGGIKWANIDLDGRDARLSGEAPDAAAIGRAEELVAAVHGIRLVDAGEVTLAARATIPRPTAPPPPVVEAEPPPPGTSTAAGRRS